MSTEKPKKKYEPKLKINGTFGDALKVMVNAKPKKEPKQPKK